MKIKKGDMVQVISGDDKGLRGEVHVVMPREQRVVVSGVNLIKKHQRRTGNVRTQTGIIEREAPIHISNVALVCPHCNEAVRVGYEKTPEGKVRVCRRCGEVID
ncbi:MAG: 50S ribosomal protein L24 [Chloroflexi bacterium]|nr:50S ribosomal protein L24 [Chloroflexota bacterium]